MFIKFVNDVVYPQRFKSVQKYIMNEHQIIFNVSVPEMISKQDQRGSTTSFRTYNAYKVVYGKNEYRNFNKLIFRQNV